MAQKYKPLYRVYYGPTTYRPPGRPYKEFTDINKARAFLAQNYESTATELPEYIIVGRRTVGLMTVEKKYGGLKNVIGWIPDGRTKHDYYMVDPQTGKLVAYLDDGMIIPLTRRG